VVDQRLKQDLRRLRDSEEGETRLKDAPLHMGLLYPSPYRAAMSSLGYLQVYRLANARQGTVVERAVLPEPDAIALHKQTRTPLLTIETQRPVRELDVLGISHAYELELAGIVHSAAFRDAS
jgi:hypothetical protein